MTFTPSRGVDATFLSSLAAPLIFPVMLVHLDWPVTPVFAHTNIGSISFDSQTWLGVGQLGSIDGAEEGQGMVPSELTVALAGILADQIDWADNDDIFGRAMNLYVGATTTPGGNTLIGAPTSVFAGYMERSRFTFQPNEGGDSTKIFVSGKSGPSARAAGEMVHTDETQQALFPGDTFFERLQHAVKESFDPIPWPAR